MIWEDVFMATMLLFLGTAFSFAVWKWSTTRTPKDKKPSLFSNTDKLVYGGLAVFIVGIVLAALYTK